MKSLTNNQLLGIILSYNRLENNFRENHNDISPPNFHKKENLKNMYLKTTSVVKNYIGYLKC